jgi:hypothetical protein
MAKAMGYNVAGGLQGMLKDGTKTFEGEGPAFAVPVVLVPPSDAVHLYCERCG